MERFAGTVEDQVAGREDGTLAMNCIDYRMSMLPYLKRELSVKKTRKLLSHVEECAECREELKVQFLVMEGMKRLEYGKTFRLEEDFEKSLKTSAREYKMRDILQKLLLCLLYGGCALVTLFLLKGIFL